MYFAGSTSQSRAFLVPDFCIHAHNHGVAQKSVNIVCSVPSITTNQFRDGDVLSAPLIPPKGVPNERIDHQIAQRTEIGEDKARQAAEAAISFFKTKFPSVGGQLDNLLQEGAVSNKAGGMTEKVKEGLGTILGKKTA